LPALSPPADGGATSEGTVTDRLLVPVLGLCLLVGTAGYLMVFTMLGQIGASLRASGTMIGWIVVATIIMGTVCAALFPALGAAIGQRRLMTAAMACLALGSVVSAAAPDAATLLAGRIIAAPGFAATALSVATVREHRSGRDLPRAMSGIAAFEGAAAGVGFALGGAVEQAAGGDWRSVFLAMAAICAITAALSAVTIPGGTVPGRAGPGSTGSGSTGPGSTGPGSTGEARRADVPGAMLLAAGLVAALLPITEGAAWGWTSPRVTGLFAGAAVVLTAWAVVELRSTDPLVRLGVLARPGVAGGIMLFFVTEATVSVINLTVPSFLEAPAAAGYGAAASVLGTGLAMLPFSLTITVAGFAAGRLAARVPARLIAAAGLACEAVALGLLTGFGHTAVQVVILVAVFGAGHGATIAAMFVILTRAVPAAAAGPASGLASAGSGISGAVLSAVTTALLTSRLVHAGTVTLPAAAGYGHAWLCGAAIAAIAAIAVVVAMAAGVMAYTARAPRTSGPAALGGPLYSARGPQRRRP
jgi:MFS family permease